MLEEIFIGSEVFVKEWSECLWRHVEESADCARRLDESSLFMFCQNLPNLDLLIWLLIESKKEYKNLSEFCIFDASV